jgi:hypothetical protein
MADGSAPFAVGGCAGRHCSVTRSTRPAPWQIYAFEAGSALPAPFPVLAVGDVDGDRRDELATLEYRSPFGTFHKLRLTDGNDDGTLDMAVR